MDSDIQNKPAAETEGVSAKAEAAQSGKKNKIQATFKPHRIK